MCGIPRELPLRREPLVKPFNHIVKRMAELFEFGQDVLADFHIGQIIRLNFFRLRSERTKRLQCLTADKIRKHAAGERDRRRDVPVRDAEGRLRAADDDRQLVIVRSLSASSLSGLNESGSLPCVSPQADILLPMESIYRLPE